LQKFCLHPAAGRAKNDLTKAFVNLHAVLAINTIAVRSMIAYVGIGAVLTRAFSIQPIGFSFTSVRDTSWLS
jgi:hypothetical protein